MHDFAQTFSLPFPGQYLGTWWGPCTLMTSIDFSTQAIFTAEAEFLLELNILAGRSESHWPIGTQLDAPETLLPIQSLCWERNESSVIPLCSRGRQQVVLTHESGRDLGSSGEFWVGFSCPIYLPQLLYYQKEQTSGFLFLSQLSLLQQR